MEKEFEKILKEFEKFLKEEKSNKKGTRDIEKARKELKEEIGESIGNMKDYAVCVVDDKAFVYGSSEDIMNAIGGLVDGALTNTNIDKEDMRGYLNYIINEAE